MDKGYFRAVFDNALVGNKYINKHLFLGESSIFGSIALSVQ